MAFLVVDDIERNRNMLEQYIAGLGYDVLTAAGGQEAIDLAAEHDLELVLMDICMPGVDGYDAARAIKKSAGDEYLPVIFVSALDETKAMKDAVEAGGDDYVTKPISFDVLSAKINAHLRIRDLQLQLKNKNDELQEHNYRLEREHQLISNFFDYAKKNNYSNDRLIKQHISSMSLYNGDVFLIARRPCGGVSILLGDFTGHGLSAAVGSLPVAQVFFRMVKEGVYIGDIAKELNRQVRELLPVEMFFAASLIEISLSGERMMVWHGGLPDMLIHRKSENVIEEVSSKNMPLGILGEEAFITETDFYTLEKDDCVYFYTDGLTEGLNSGGEMFGEDRVKNAITENPDNGFDAIVSSYHEFTRNTSQDDDISLIELTSMQVEHESLDDEKNYAASAGWSLDVVVKDDKLSKVDAVRETIEIIGNDALLRHHKGVVYTLLSEMYNNALEHGILNINGVMKEGVDGFEEYYQHRKEGLKKLKGYFIRFSIELVTEEQSALLRMRLEHNGTGFDPDAVIAEIDDLHGRGISLIRGLADEVEYADSGRCLSVLFRL